MLPGTTVLSKELIHNHGYEEKRRSADEGPDQDQGL